jgi:hypothetical protein
MGTCRRLALVTLIVQAISWSARSDTTRPSQATRNVVLVTTDGLRWQEVFRGADRSLMNSEDGGVSDVEALRREFWRGRVESRREALLPFFWTVIARQGQLFGNINQRSRVRVTNGMNFSYPGYNEILTGSADPWIDSNAKVANANITVLEWLNRKPEFRGKVAAFGSWDVYPWIFHRERSGLLVNAGWELIQGDSLSSGQILLNRLMSQSPRVWDDCRHDTFTFQAALEHLRGASPRVLYIGLGDTDEFAHEGRYEPYLRAAHNFDANLRLLWEELQANPVYRGTTSLIVTTDHGRGGRRADWRDHGAKVKSSDEIWIGLLGPDTPTLGERTDVETLTQGQVAATLAALLGEDYCAAVRRAAPPIQAVIHPASQREAQGSQAASPISTVVQSRVSRRDFAKEPLRRIAFGSCARQNEPQPIWDAVAAARPEVFLFLGDNIYGDTENMEVMKAKYAKLAAFPGFQRLRRNCRILATWDDHDLGLNDGGHDYPKRTESQQVFLDFFEEPADSPRRKRPGVYHAYLFGPADKRVQVILLDTRYFRSPLHQNEKRRLGEGPYDAHSDRSTTILGEDQWRWLGEQLRVPAELRIIGSSIQVVAEDHGWEKWMNFPHERERLYRLIRDSKAEGVLFLSGDRHLAELSMMDAHVGYPIYDLTSSGLNQGSKTWRPSERNRHRVATMSWGDNFGVITIDWDQPDPLMRLQIRDVEGDIVIQQKVPLSLLHPSDPPADE